MFLIPAKICMCFKERLREKVRETLDPRHVPGPWQKFQFPSPSRGLDEKVC